MSAKALVPVLYLYIEASKVKNTTEYYYFSLLSRELNFALKPYDNLNTLKKDVKQKRPRDIVAAVIDLDVDQNDIRNSLVSRSKSILTIRDRVPGIKLFLSNRFWENWIVYHFSDTNRFVDDALKLPIPNYEKGKLWYLKNMPVLISEVETAKRRAQQRRGSLNHSFSIHDRNNLPIVSRSSLEELFESQAFTYVDLLIEKLQEL